MRESALKELYVDELRDLYHAEQLLTKALPKMAKASTSDDLRAGFENHLNQTKGHVRRLEKIFDGLGEKPAGKRCKGMMGLIKEGEDMMEEDLDDEARDAGLISAAQKVEHYEIAAYGCVRTYANLLGDNQAASLLESTLQEEKDTDAALTEIAEEINVEAAEVGEEEEEEERGSRPSRSGRAAKT